MLHKTTDARLQCCHDDDFDAVEGLKTKSCHYTKTSSVAVQQLAGASSVPHAFQCKARFKAVFLSNNACSQIDRVY